MENAAFFSIFAGTGGKDAEDWVSILLKMYLKFFQKKGFKVKEISRQTGEGGIKSVTLEVKGKVEVNGKILSPFEYLKNENGVHRLVRISPFSRKGLRHTSFALVEVLPKMEDTKNISFKENELKIETFRASGPGGQYVNKRETAVRITHLPTGIQVSCQSERSQLLNKEKALALLQAKILDLKEKERRGEIEKLKGGKVVPKWGYQIRSYIFDPYQMVKDHRTQVKETKIEKVLEGNLEKFIIIK